MSLLSTIPKLVSLLCCLTLGLLIAPRPTEQISRHQHVAKLVQPDAIPSYISLSMYELDQDGDKLIPTVSCIYPGGTRSGNWGCSAYCSQGAGYPCTNPAIHPPPVPMPAGQSAWVYPFTSNQVTVEIDGSAAYAGSVLAAGIRRTSRSASTVAPRLTCPSSAEDISPRTSDGLTRPRQNSQRKTTRDRCRRNWSKLASLAIDK